MKYNFVEGYLIKEELTMKTKKVIVAAMMAGIVGMSAEASYLGSGYGAPEGGV